MVRCLNVLVGVLAALACLGAGVGSAFAQPVTLPTSGSGSGTETVPPGSSSFELRGTVTGTLGTGTFHGTGAQTGATSFTVNTTTVYPNGTLDQSEAGTDTGTGTATLTATITGGTGRFAGAIGFSTIQSTSTPSGTPGVSNFHFHIDGDDHPCPRSPGALLDGAGAHRSSCTEPELHGPVGGLLSYQRTVCGVGSLR